MGRAGSSGATQSAGEKSTPQKRGAGERISTPTRWPFSLASPRKTMRHSCSSCVKGIGEDDQQAVLERLVQIEQPAVGVNDNGFAGLAELAAVGVLSRGHHANPHEHARTASRLFVVDFSHREAMLRQLTAPALAQASP